MQVSAAERAGRQQHPRCACFTICAQTILECASASALIRARCEVLLTPETEGEAAPCFIGARFVLALHVSRGQRTVWICICLGFLRRRASIGGDIGPRILPGRRPACRDSSAVALSARRVRRARRGNSRGASHARLGARRPRGWGCAGGFDGFEARSETRPSSVVHSRPPTALHRLRGPLHWTYRISILPHLVLTSR